MRFAVLAAVLLCAAPADAAVTVIGSSPARECYLGARAAPSVNMAAMAQCDLAIAGGGTLDGKDLVATHVNRGILRALSGRLPAAIADYDAAIALDDGQAEAWLNKGLALLRADAPRNAVPMFDAAIVRGTRMPAVAHFARALAHEANGEVRAAYADLVQARDLSPRWSAPVRELARYQLRRR